MTANISLQRTIQSLSPWTRHWLQGTSTPHPLTTGASPTVLARRFVPRLQASEHFAQQIAQRHTVQTVAPIQRNATQPQVDSKSSKPLTLVGQAGQLPRIETTQRIENPIARSTDQQQIDFDNIDADENPNTDTDTGRTFLEDSFIDRSSPSSDTPDHDTDRPQDRYTTPTISEAQVQRQPIQRKNEPLPQHPVGDSPTSLPTQERGNVRLDSEPKRSLTAMIEERIQRAQMGLPPIAEAEGTMPAPSATSRSAPQSEQPRVQRSRNESPTTNVVGESPSRAQTSSMSGKSLVSMIEERIMRAQEGLSPIPPEEENTEDGNAGETASEPGEIVQAKPENQSFSNESASLQVQSDTQGQADAESVEQPQSPAMQRPSLMSLIDQRIQAASGEERPQAKRAQLPPQVRRLMAYSTVEEISAGQAELPPPTATVQRSPTTKMARKEEETNQSSTVEPEIETNAPVADNGTVHEPALPETAIQAQKAADLQSDVEPAQPQTLVTKHDQQIEQTPPDHTTPFTEQISSNERLSDAEQGHPTASSIQRSVDKTEPLVNEREEGKGASQTETSEDDKISTNEPKPSLTDAVQAKLVSATTLVAGDPIVDSSNIKSAQVSSETIKRSESPSTNAEGKANSSTAEEMSEDTSLAELDSQGVNNKALGETEVADGSTSLPDIEIESDDQVSPLTVTDSSTDEPPKTIRRKPQPSTSPQPKNAEQPIKDIQQDNSSEAIRPELSVTKHADIEQGKTGEVVQDRSFPTGNENSEAISIPDSGIEPTQPTPATEQAVTQAFIEPTQEKSQIAVVRTIDRAAAPVNLKATVQTKPMLVFAAPRIQAKEAKARSVEASDSESVDPRITTTGDAVSFAQERKSRAVGTSARSDIQPSRSAKSITRQVSPEKIAHRRALDESASTTNVASSKSESGLPKVIGVNTQPAAQPNSTTKSEMPDLDQLARQLLPLIKQMIRVERERSPYR